MSHTDYRRRIQPHTYVIPALVEHEESHWWDRLLPNKKKKANADTWKFNASQVSQTTESKSATVTAKDKAKQAKDSAEQQYELKVSKARDNWDKRNAARHLRVEQRFASQKENIDGYNQNVDLFLNYAQQEILVEHSRLRELMIREAKAYDKALARHKIRFQRLNRQSNSGDFLSEIRKLKDSTKELVKEWPKLQRQSARLDKLLERVNELGDIVKSNDTQKAEMYLFNRHAAHVSVSDVYKDDYALDFQIEEDTYKNRSNYGVQELMVNGTPALESFIESQRAFVKKQRPAMWVRALTFLFLPPFPISLIPYPAFWEDKVWFKPDYRIRKHYTNYIDQLENQVQREKQELAITAFNRCNKLSADDCEYYYEIKIERVKDYLDVLNQEIEKATDESYTSYLKRLKVPLENIHQQAALIFDRPEATKADKKYNDKALAELQESLAKLLTDQAVDEKFRKNNAGEIYAGNTFLDVYAMVRTRRTFANFKAYVEKHGDFKVAHIDFSHQKSLLHFIDEEINMHTRRTLWDDVTGALGRIFRATPPVLRVFHVWMLPFFATFALLNGITQGAYLTYHAIENARKSVGQFIDRITADNGAHWLWIVPAAILSIPLLLPVYVYYGLINITSALYRSKTLRWIDRGITKAFNAIGGFFDQCLQKSKWHLPWITLVFVAVLPLTILAGFYSCIFRLGEYVSDEPLDVKGAADLTKPKTHYVIADGSKDQYIQYLELLRSEIDTPLKDYLNANDERATAFIDAYIAARAEKGLLTLNIAEDASLETKKYVLIKAFGNNDGKEREFRHEFMQLAIEDNRKATPTKYNVFKRATRLRQLDDRKSLERCQISLVNPGEFIGLDNEALKKEIRHMFADALSQEKYKSAFSDAYQAARREAGLQSLANVSADKVFQAYHAATNDKPVEREFLRDFIQKLADSHNVSDRWARCFWDQVESSDMQSMESSLRKVNGALERLGTFRIVDDCQQSTNFIKKFNQQQTAQNKIACQIRYQKHKAPFQDAFKKLIDNGFAEEFVNAYNKKVGEHNKTKHANIEKFEKDLKDFEELLPKLDALLANGQITAEAAEEKKLKIQKVMASVRECLEEQRAEAIESIKCESPRGGLDEQKLLKALRERKVSCYRVFHVELINELIKNEAAKENGVKAYSDILKICKLSLQEMSRVTLTQRLQQRFDSVTGDFGRLFDYIFEHGVNKNPEVNGRRDWGVDDVIRVTARYIQVAITEAENEVTKEAEAMKAAQEAMEDMPVVQNDPAALSVSERVEALKLLLNIVEGTQLKKLTDNQRRLLTNLIPEHRLNHQAFGVNAVEYIIARYTMVHIRDLLNHNNLSDINADKKIEQYVLLMREDTEIDLKKLYKEIAYKEQELYQRIFYVPKGAEKRFADRPLTANEDFDECMFNNPETLELINDKNSLLKKSTIKVEKQLNEGDVDFDRIELPGFDPIDLTLQELERAQRRLMFYPDARVAAAELINAYLKSPLVAGMERYNITDKAVMTSIVQAYRDSGDLSECLNMLFEAGKITQEQAEHLELVCEDCARYQKNPTEAFDGNNTQYAMVIRVTANESLAALWLKTYLDAHLTDPAVFTDSHVEKFLMDSRTDIHNPRSECAKVFNRAISNYISEGNQPENGVWHYHWDEDTAKLIEDYANAENKERYRSKRLREFLKDGLNKGFIANNQPRRLEREDPELRAYLETVRLFLTQVKENNYSTRLGLNSLNDALRDHLSNDYAPAAYSEAWSQTAELIFTELATPEMLQELRTNKVIYLLNPQYADAAKQLVQAKDYIRYLNAANHSIYANTDESIYKVGVAKIHKAFRQYLDDDNALWCELAERLFLEFVPNEKIDALRDLRLRNVSKLLDHNNIAQTERYFDFIEKGNSDLGGKCRARLIEESDVEGQALFAALIEPHFSEDKPWSFNVHAIITKAGTPEQLDRYRIKMVKEMRKEDNVQNTLQHFLKLEKEPFEIKELRKHHVQSSHTPLVKTAEGNQALNAVLTNFVTADTPWSYNTMMLVKAFGSKQLLQTYNRKRLHELMSNTGQFAGFVNPYREFFEKGQWDVLEVAKAELDKETTGSIEKAAIKDNAYFTAEEVRAIHAFMPVEEEMEMFAVKQGDPHVRLSAIERHFGENSLEELRDIMADYVYDKTHRANKGETANYLCGLLLSNLVERKKSLKASDKFPPSFVKWLKKQPGAKDAKSHAALMKQEVERFIAENDGRVLTLKGIWDMQRAEDAESKNISLRIQRVIEDLYAGDYVTARKLYEQEGTNLHAAAFNGSAEDAGKYRELLTRIAAGTKEFFKRNASYLDRSDEFEDSLNIPAQQIGKAQHVQKARQLLAEISQFERDKCTSHELKEKLNVMKGAPGKLEDYALLLGNKQIFERPARAERLAANDTRMPELREYVLIMPLDKGTEQLNDADDKLGRQDGKKYFYKVLKEYAEAVNSADQKTVEQFRDHASNLLRNLTDRYYNLFKARMDDAMLDFFKSEKFTALNSDFVTKLTGLAEMSDSVDCRAQVATIIHALMQDLRPYANPVDLQQYAEWIEGANEQAIKYIAREFVHLAQIAGSDRKQLAEELLKLFKALYQVRAAETVNEYNVQLVVYKDIRSIRNYVQQASDVYELQRLKRVAKQIETHDEYDHVKSALYRLKQSFDRKPVKDKGKTAAAEKTKQKHSFKSQLHVDIITQDEIEFITLPEKRKGFCAHLRYFEKQLQMVKDGQKATITFNSEHPDLQGLPVNEKASSMATIVFNMFKQLDQSRKAGLLAEIDEVRHGLVKNPALSEALQYMHDIISSGDNGADATKGERVVQLEAYFKQACEYDMHIEALQHFYQAISQQQASAEIPFKSMLYLSRQIISVDRDTHVTHMKDLASTNVFATDLCETFDRVVAQGKPLSQPALKQQYAAYKEAVRKIDAVVNRYASSAEDKNAVRELFNNDDIFLTKFSQTKTRTHETRRKLFEDILRVREEFANTDHVSQAVKSNWQHVSKVVQILMLTREIQDEIADKALPLVLRQTNECLKLVTLNQDPIMKRYLQGNPTIKALFMDLIKRYQTEIEPYLDQLRPVNDKSRGRRLTSNFDSIETVYKNIQGFAKIYLGVPSESEIDSYGDSLLAPELVDVVNRLNDFRQKIYLAAVSKTNALIQGMAEKQKNNPHLSDTDESLVKERMAVLQLAQYTQRFDKDRLMTLGFLFERYLEDHDIFAAKAQARLAGGDIVAPKYTREDVGLRSCSEFIGDDNPYALLMKRLHLVKKGVFSNFALSQQQLNAIRNSITPLQDKYLITLIHDILCDTSDNAPTDATREALLGLRVLFRPKEGKMLSISKLITFRKIMNSRESHGEQKGLILKLLNDHRVIENNSQYTQLAKYLGVTFSNDQLWEDKAVALLQAYFRTPLLATELEKIALEKHIQDIHKILESAQHTPELYVDLVTAHNQGAPQHKIASPLYRLKLADTFLDQRYSISAEFKRGVATAALKNVYDVLCASNAPEIFEEGKGEKLGYDLRIAMNASPSVINGVNFTLEKLQKIYDDLTQLYLKNLKGRSRAVTRTDSQTVELIEQVAGAGPLGDAQQEAEYDGDVSVKPDGYRGNAFTEALLRNAANSEAEINRLETQKEGVKKGVLKASHAARFRCADNHQGSMSKRAHNSMGVALVV